MRQVRYESWKNTLENFQPTVWGTYKPEWIEFRPTELPRIRRNRDDTMARFLIKRLLNMIPLIIGITFLSFLVMSLVPGNFLTNLKLNPAISPAGDPPDGGAVRPRSAADGALLRSGCGR